MRSWCFWASSATSLTLAWRSDACLRNSRASAIFVRISLFCSSSASCSRTWPFICLILSISSRSLSVVKTSVCWRYSMYSICFWSSLIPRFFRVPCSFLNASISSNRTFALSLNALRWALISRTSWLYLSRRSLFFWASSTNSRVWLLRVLRSRANLLADAFSSFRRFLCSSDSARVFFLFSIKSFNMRSCSSSDFPLQDVRDYLVHALHTTGRICRQILPFHSEDNSACSMQDGKHQKRQSA